MSISIYNSLSLRPLQPMGVLIQLINRSVTRPTSFIEDILVWIGELIFLLIFIFLIWKRGFPRILP